MSKNRRILNPELQEARKLERIAALEARRLRRAEEEKKRLMEEEAKKKKVSVDHGLFVQICKFGFLNDTTPSGRVEIVFNRIDIQNLIAGSVVEKVYYGQVYNFLLLGMDRIQKHQVLKNSPLYWQLADTI